MVDADRACGRRERAGAADLAQQMQRIRRQKTLHLLQTHLAILPYLFALNDKE